MGPILRPEGFLASQFLEESARDALRWRASLRRRRRSSRQSRRYRVGGRRESPEDGCEGPLPSKDPWGMDTWREARGRQSPCFSMRLSMRLA